MLFIGFSGLISCTLYESQGQKDFDTIIDKVQNLKTTDEVCFFIPPEQDPSLWSAKIEESVEKKGFYLKFKFLYNKNTICYELKGDPLSQN